MKKFSRPPQTADCQTTLYISHQGVPRGFAFLCLAARAHNSRNFSELLQRRKVCADKTPGLAKGKEGDTVRSGGWLFRGRLRLQKSRKSRYYSAASPASAVGSIRYLPAGKNYIARDRRRTYSKYLGAVRRQWLTWLLASRGSLLPSHLDHFLFLVGATFVLLYGSNFLS